MANYYLDINVLVVYSFLQNRWQEHTHRLFITDNTLHTSEFVLYEYCVKSNPGPPSTDTTIDWASDDGVFGTVQRNLRKAKRYTELELRRYDDEDLNPEMVADAFIKKFDIEDEVSDKIRYYFEKELATECNKKAAREATDKIVNTITSTARDRKLELARRVRFHRRTREHPYIEKQLRRLIYGEDESYGPDAAVLTDAYDLKIKGIVKRVVTGDKGDIYLNSEKIDAITGLSVLYLKDEFAGQVS